MAKCSILDISMTWASGIHLHGSKMCVLAVYTNLIMSLSYIKWDFLMASLFCGPSVPQTPEAIDGHEDDIYILYQKIQKVY